MFTRQRIKEKEIKKENILLILSVFPLVFLAFGIIIGIKDGGVLDGFVKITKSPTILITDFLELGGLGASFINAGIIGLFNLYLLKRFNMRMSGLLIAAFMTLLGFSFFGKNLINIIPLYIGGYLYAKNQGIHMKDIIAVTMFSTGLSPIISELMFSLIIPAPYNILVGIIVGILIGFIIAPVSAHMLKFHDGYNLYNIGFTAGIVGTVYTSILRSFNIETAPVSILYQDNDTHIKILLLLLFIMLIAIGLLINKNGIKFYHKLFSHSGRTVSDFTFLTGYGITFINMGIMGILSVLFVLVVGGVMNGPVLAGVLTVVGFAAFGKHPRNCLPIACGVILAAMLLGKELSTTGIIISVLFSTTIAPIAGTYGVVVGVFAGMLHLALVTNIGIIHGGINLYNNGFSGGLVAGFLIPIIEAFKKGD